MNTSNTPNTQEKQRNTPDTPSNYNEKIAGAFKQGKEGNSPGNPEEVTDDSCFNILKSYRGNKECIETNPEKFLGYLKIYLEKIGITSDSEDLEKICIMGGNEDLEEMVLKIMSAIKDWTLIKEMCIYACKNYKDKVEPGTKLECIYGALRIILAYTEYPIACMYDMFERSKTPITGLGSA